MSLKAPSVYLCVMLEDRNVPAMKQHDNQHAHGFGKDIKDQAIWVKLLKPQEGGKRRKKEGSRSKITKLQVLKSI